MMTLYWKAKKDQYRNLPPKPFQSETEFETYIFQNQEYLPDLYILHRQIRTGNRQGIPDMLGIDQDAKICIIEMKNSEVGEEILQQILGYAMWVETNPDSIKAIWLETKGRPEDIQIDWDSLEIRVIIIAPSFKPILLKMAGKINYQVDLIQIKRFNYQEDEFVIVETLEKISNEINSTTKVKGNWDWDFYKKEHGEEATTQFKRAVVALADFTKHMQWELPFNLNELYTGFKYGNKVVFDVSWQGTRTWAIRLKLREAEAENFQGKNWKYQRYDAAFKNALFRLIPDQPIDVKELESLLTKAYKNVTSAWREQ